MQCDKDHPFSDSQEATTEDIAELAALMRGDDADTALAAAKALLRHGYDE